jgi:REP element-mobilizing transposase RayT
MGKVTCGGLWEANIFPTDVDRHDFLKTLAEACQKTGFEVHAYCLMSNHFHLVVETPKANLVAGMQWLLSSTPFVSIIGTSFLATCSADATKLCS